MNRMEEWAALQKELEETPPELAFTMTRVKARTKRGKTLRFFGVPAASLAGVFTAFVLLVNLSLPFALACVNTPFLKELMAAVAVTPSLKAMVVNDYIQPVELTAEKDGAKMTIHYIACGGGEVNLFYTASWNGNDQVEIWPEYSLPDGGEMESYSFDIGYAPEKGKLSALNLEFIYRELPEQLHLTANLYPAGERPEENMFERTEAPSDSVWDRNEPVKRREPVATLEFDIPFDHALAKAKKVFAPKAALDLDGQTVTLETVTVYPTSTKLEFSEAPDNGAFLKGLSLQLVDGRGKVYGPRANAITSQGNTYWLESAFFAKGDLTLEISEAKWLDKEWETVTLDFNDPAAAKMPKDLVFTGIERKGKDVRLLPGTAGVEAGIGSTYYTPNGEKRHLDTWMFNSNVGGTSTFLWDYPRDSVTLELSHNRVTRWEEPVRVELAEAAL